MGTYKGTPEPGEYPVVYLNKRSHFRATFYSLFGQKKKKEKGMKKKTTVRRMKKKEKGRKKKTTVKRMKRKTRSIRVSDAE